ncbi:hypothetical protein C0583_00900 [Candidatus Parcubacteria bacterium]|nr:MAG: hypothetical protein C0583_00900 [Candidatus Parcubacteria bacterium]
MIKNLIKNRKQLLSIFILAFFCISFFKVDYALADAGDMIVGFAKGAVLSAIGVAVSLIVSLLGFFLNLVTSAVFVVAKYNNFVNEFAVTEGWEQVRDLCNMFFILILLVIAFATILRVENYNIKKLLPKLLIMAVLINFSKAIAGFIIEFAQVVMMTFMNVINANGSGFIDAFGVSKYLETVKSDIFNSDNIANNKLNFNSTVVGYLSALIFLAVSLFTMLALLMVLLMRMIMIWVYIVLSPLAYLLAAFPQGQKYASRWWDEFIKYVVTGPVLAFFIWLALVAANKTPVSMAGNTACFGPAEMFCTNSFLQFLIAIGMLIGGLKVTSEIGGAVGGAAGDALKRINSGKAMTVKFAKNRTKVTAKWGGRSLIGGAGFALQKTPLSKIPGAKSAGQVASTWASDLRNSRFEEKGKARLKTLEKLGMGTKTQGKLKEIKENASETKVGKLATTINRFMSFPDRKEMRDYREKNRESLETRGRISDNTIKLEGLKEQLKREVDINKKSLLKIEISSTEKAIHEDQQKYDSLQKDIKDNFSSIAKSQGSVTSGALATGEAKRAKKKKTDNFQEIISAQVDEKAKDSASDTKTA